MFGITDTVLTLTIEPDEIAAKFKFLIKCLNELSNHALVAITTNDNITTLSASQYRTDKEIDAFARLFLNTQGNASPITKMELYVNDITEQSIFTFVVKR